VRPEGDDFGCGAESDATVGRDGGFGPFPPRFDALCGFTGLLKFNPRLENSILMSSLTVWA
jgi:hypothetical protein